MAGDDPTDPDVEPADDQPANIARIWSAPVRDGDPNPHPHRDAPPALDRLRGNRGRRHGTRRAE
jgi:hypothetical protein